MQRHETDLTAAPMTFWRTVAPYLTKLICNFVLPEEVRILTRLCELETPFHRDGGKRKCYRRRGVAKYHPSRGAITISHHWKQAEISFVRHIPTSVFLT